MMHQHVVPALPSAAVAICTAAVSKKLTPQSLHRQDCVDAGGMLRWESCIQAWRRWCCGPLPTPWVFHQYPALFVSGSRVAHGLSVRNDTLAGQSFACTLPQARSRGVVGAQFAQKGCRRQRLSAKVFARGRHRWNARLTVSRLGSRSINA